MLKAVRGSSDISAGHKSGFALLPPHRAPEGDLTHDSLTGMLSQDQYLKHCFCGQRSKRNSDLMVLATHYGVLPMQTLLGMLLLQDDEADVNVDSLWFYRAVDTGGRLLSHANGVEACDAVWSWWAYAACTCQTWLHMCMFHIQCTNSSGEVDTSSMEIVRYIYNFHVACRPHAICTCNSHVHN